MTEMRVKQFGRKLVSVPIYLADDSVFDQPIATPEGGWPAGVSFELRFGDEITWETKRSDAGDLGWSQTVDEVNEAIGSKVSEVHLFKVEGDRPIKLAVLSVLRNAETP